MQVKSGARNNAANHLFGVQSARSADSVLAITVEYGNCVRIEFLNETI